MKLAVVALLAGCTSGTPPGVSGGYGGDNFTMPLVGPLEDGTLLTAVTINTHGPYVFAIDPDAPMSVIDASLVKPLELRTFSGPRRLDETDTQQTRIYAELLNLEIGTMIIERRDVFVVRSKAFDTAGRRVVGVLGKDIFADSMAWGFDRDNGLVYLTTQKAFQPPPDATPIAYTEYPTRITNARVPPPPRRLVGSVVNGAKVTLHVDLGETASQLRETAWETAKLSPREVKSVAVDEVGEGRLVTKASAPAEVALGPVTNERVAFVPYTDKRWPSEDVDGTLGLGFFAAHDVWQSWHTKQYFVMPRKPVAAAIRINRWDSAVLSRCKNAGCVTIRITDPMTGKPVEEGKPLPGLVLAITREDVAGGMGLEVILDAVAPDGGPGAAPAALPRLAINLPGHVDKLLYPLPAAFRGTTLSVVDASPFPRDCPTPHGCIDQLAR